MSPEMHIHINETGCPAEHDDAISEGLDASSHGIDKNYLKVPALPGFGLRLVEEVFQQAIQAGSGVLA